MLEFKPAVFQLRLLSHSHTLHPLCKLHGSNEVRSVVFLKDATVAICPLLLPCYEIYHPQPALLWEPPAEGTKALLLALFPSHCQSIRRKVSTGEGSRQQGGFVFSVPIYHMQLCVPALGKISRNGKHCQERVVSVLPSFLY